MSSASNPLYRRWIETATRFADEPALIQLEPRRAWSFRELIAEGAHDVPGNERIISPQGNDAGFVITLLRAWCNGRVTCPTEAGQNIPALEKIPDGIMHLKLTSATGGATRCVAFRSEQLAADVENIVSTMRLSRAIPNIGCISLAHSYGFSNLILPLLLHGIPLVLVPAPLPELLLRAAGLFPEVTLAAVPALWRAWYQTGSIPANVRIAISAGAALPLELESAIYESRGLKIHNFYGSSECGGIAYDRTEIPRTDPNCAGTAMDRVALSIANTGTLLVESCACGETYLPEGQPSLRAGRFETSDLATLTERGLYLHGRVSDVINVAGRKVLPESIEAAVRACPGTRECVVFGVPDPDPQRVESIVACVNCEGNPRSSAFIHLLSSRLPAWQIPRQWWFTTELESNARGKISRAEWKARFLEKAKSSAE